MLRNHLDALICRGQAVAGLLQIRQSPRQAAFHMRLLVHHFCLPRLPAWLPDFTHFCGTNWAEVKLLMKGSMHAYCVS